MGGRGRGTAAGLLTWHGKDRRASAWAVGAGGNETLDGEGSWEAHRLRREQSFLQKVRRGPGRAPALQGLSKHLSAAALAMARRMVAIILRQALGHALPLYRFLRSR